MISKRLQITQSIIYGVLLLVGIILLFINNEFIKGIGGSLVSIFITGIFAFALNKSFKIHWIFKSLMAIIAIILTFVYLDMHMAYFPTENFFYVTYSFNMIITFFIIILLRLFLVNSRQYFVITLLTPFIIISLGLLFGKAFDLSSIISSVILIGGFLAACKFGSSYESVSETVNFVGSDGTKYNHVYGDVYQDQYGNYYELDSTGDYLIKK